MAHVVIRALGGSLMLVRDGYYVFRQGVPPSNSSIISYNYCCLNYLSLIEAHCSVGLLLSRLAWLTISVPAIGHTCTFACIPLQGLSIGRHSTSLGVPSKQDFLGQPSS